MRVVIRIDPADKAKALALLVHHSPGTALPDRTFIVSEAALEALRAAGVKLTELAREPGVPWSEGTVAGERI